MARDITLLLAGDTIITRPWSQVRDRAFLDLIEQIRAADVAIANLETVIHTFKGYAQADSGGTYMATPPELAAELKWAGFDMLAHANNHSFDYGTEGILETIEHVERAGLLLAGSGKDLQEARSPRYFNSDAGTVALVAMASDFISYGVASDSRPDLRGRPGLNPLTLKGERAILLPPAMLDRLQVLATALGRDPSARRKGSLRLGLRFRASDRYGIIWGRRILAKDQESNLQAISEAARRADFVVCSIHAHRQGPWLTQFAHQAIDHGAGVVFVHGPHHVRGVELYRNKPILYSLGDFVFEQEHISRFPAEEYERVGLDTGATVTELRAAKAGVQIGVASLSRDRRAFEGIAASLVVREGEVTRIRLLPVDLHFDCDERRGRPQLASAELGKRIIEDVAKRSKRYGTSIKYDPVANCGVVV